VGAGVGAATETGASAETRFALVIDFWKVTTCAGFVDWLAGGTEDFVVIGTVPTMDGESV
jgi:hypothetical protein